MSAPASAASAADGAHRGLRRAGQGRERRHRRHHDLAWPDRRAQVAAMTMGFASRPKAFADVKPGDTVHFEFKEGGRRATSWSRCSASEEPSDRRAHPLVGRQPLPGAARDRVPGRGGRLWSVARTPLDALARPVRRAGHHPHDLSRPGAADRRGPGHLSARPRRCCRCRARRRCAAIRSSATRSSTCCSRTAPTCTGRARACSST